MEPIAPIDLAHATGDYDAIGGVAAASAIGVIVFLQYLSVRAL